MDISIIIVTWNARDYARELLESLDRDGSLISREVIVVDNASEDGTPQMIASEFPQVVLIRNTENLGFARGNNVGIERAMGKYLLLVNSDVNVPPGCIDRIHSFMEQNPAVGILGPRMLGGNGETRRSCMRFPTLWNTICRSLSLDMLLPRSKIFGGLLMRDFQFNRVMDVEVLNGWFWAVRKSALEQVGLLDERFFMYAEDVDWCYRFHSRGWRAVFLADVSAVHYGGASSARTPQRFYVAKVQANIQYWLKHQPVLQQRIYIAIVWLGECLRAVAYGMEFLMRISRQDALYKMKRSVAAMRLLAGRHAMSEEKMN